MRCYQQHSHGLSICGLPSFRIPPIPSSPSCRKAAPSTTGDLGAEMEMGQWVMGHGSNRSPFLDGSHGSWVTANDPLTHDDEINAQ